MNLERKLRISLQEVQWVSPLAQERNDETDLLQPNYQSTGSRPPSSTFTWERIPVWHLRDHKVDKYKRTGCLKAEYQKYKINIEKPFLTHKKQFLPHFQILYREQS